MSSPAPRTARRAEPQAVVRLTGAGADRGAFWLPRQTQVCDSSQCEQGTDTITGEDDHKDTPIA